MRRLCHVLLVLLALCVPLHPAADDDTTRRLMIRFHAGLRDDGLSPVLALRAAQREIRASIDEPFKAMHAWAGWVVWGPRD